MLDWHDSSEISSVDCWYVSCKETGDLYGVESDSFRCSFFLCDLRRTAGVCIIWLDSLHDSSEIASVDCWYVSCKEIGDLYGVESDSFRCSFFLGDLRRTAGVWIIWLDSLHDSSEISSVDCWHVSCKEIGDLYGVESDSFRCSFFLGDLRRTTGVWIIWLDWHDSSEISSVDCWYVSCKEIGDLYGLESDSFRCSFFLGDLRRTVGVCIIWLDWHDGSEISSVDCWYVSCN